MEERLENVRFPRGRLASMKTHPRAKGSTVQAKVYFLKHTGEEGCERQGGGNPG
jgi:hypothetical protein